MANGSAFKKIKPIINLLVVINKIVPLRLNKNDVGVIPKFSISHRNIDSIRVNKEHSKALR